MYTFNLIYHNGTIYNRSYLIDSKNLTIALLNLLKLPQKVPSLTNKQSRHQLSADSLYI